ncbi:MAG: 30S ribosomal protein S17 [Planctomycetota bacterium]
MRRRVTGIVTSDKMDKTIALEVQRVRQHPRYKKYLRESSTLQAHDEHNKAGEGDLVEVEETRPISKTKSWRLVRVLKRSARLKPEEEETVDILGESVSE